MKAAADSAITTGGISSRGNKLAKRKEVTHIMYAKEGDEIRTEVKQKHEEVLARWKHNCELAKAGLVEEVDNDTKIHFHLGETDTGADFSASCSGFLNVQVAYADFVKKAVAHDDNMQSLVNEKASAQALVASKDTNKCEDSNHDGNIFDDEDRNVWDDEDRQDATIGLYNIPQEFTPVLDFSVGLQGVDLDTSEWFNLNVDCLYNESDVLLQFQELDPSAPFLLNPLFEYPTTIASASVPVQDLDYYQLTQFFQDLNLQNNGALDFTVPPPLALEFTILPPLALEFTVPPLLPPAAALHHQLPDPSMVPGTRATTPLPQSTALQMLLPQLPSTPAEVTAGTPLNTATKRSLPYGASSPTCEQALNAIGSSKAHVCAMMGAQEGKENDGITLSSTKCKAKLTNQHINNHQSLYIYPTPSGTHFVPMGPMDDIEVVRLQNSEDHLVDGANLKSLSGSITGLDGANE
ncbi:hypothetical protein EV424DRAFT_1352281 [Suillus variegatus]|nr:hypothetical protein EV424DRAFT_1352281 [Suillus variegatus]